MKPAPKPVHERKRKVKIIPRRKQLEQQIEDILKLLVCWRDEAQCVMRNIDGVRCHGGLMWNHLIPQGQSKWMQLLLDNIYWGCGNHNLLDKLGDKVLAEYVVLTFGAKAFHAIQEEARIHNKQKHTIPELEELLAHYDDLYQKRYFVDTDIPSRIAAGYYGEIIKSAFDDTVAPPAGERKI